MDFVSAGADEGSLAYGHRPDAGRIKWGLERDEDTGRLISAIEAPFDIRMIKSVRIGRKCKAEKSRVMLFLDCHGDFGGDVYGPGESETVRADEIDDSLMMMFSVRMKQLQT